MTDHLQKTSILDDESGLFSEDLEGLLRSDQRIDRVHKVYVTRNLKLSSVRAIGFDMDHTLVLYQKRPIEELAFDSTVAKILKRPGYPKSLAKLRYDPNACIRGLVVDKERGNVLKMDRYNYVSMVYHGTQSMSPTEIKKHYPSDVVRFDPNRHYSVDTLFTVPEVFLFSKLVDLIDRKQVLNKTYLQAFADVRSCIDEAHRDGSIKREVMARPEKYIDDDPNLALTLHKFHKAGRKLFLLTNSELAYVDILLGFLLNGRLPAYPTWKDYFDIVTLEAGKPGFYKRTDPPQLLEERGRRRIFKGGNAHELERMLHASGDRILYFGDHTYDDILKTKRQFNWRTAMIVPGLAAEIKTSQREGRLRGELFRLYQERDAIYLRITRHYSSVGRARADKILNFSKKSEKELARMDRRARELFADVYRAEKSLSSVMVKINVLNRALFQRYNRYWGSEFSTTTEISRFAGQIADFACIYTGKVSNLLAYSPNKYFQKKRVTMPHEGP